jgi:hypothetical protein
VHRFLAHVHQQTQGIRVFVLGVMNNKVWAIISFLLQEKQLEVDNPDDRHDCAADRRDVIHLLIPSRFQHSEKPACFEPSILNWITGSQSEIINAII